MSKEVIWLEWEAQINVSDHIDFDALADGIDMSLPQPLRTEGGRPPYPGRLDGQSQQKQLAVHVSGAGARSSMRRLSTQKPH